MSCVIKIGGRAQQSLSGREPVLRRLLSHGAVLVHGGGESVTKLADALGYETRFLDGLRVTEEPLLELVEMTLSGRVSGELVRRLQRSGWPAFGLSGCDGAVLTAGLHPDRRLGAVGRDVTVDPRPLRALQLAGYLPVLAPLALGPSGELLNVNGDTVAGAVAAALKVQRLVLLTDVPGVLDHEGRTLEVVSRESWPELVRRKVIAGGMLPKLEAAFEALAQGVGWVEIRSLNHQPYTVVKEVCDVVSDVAL